jgi:hypothetical protein
VREAARESVQLRINAHLQKVCPQLRVWGLHMRSSLHGQNMTGREQRGCWGSCVVLWP